MELQEKDIAGLVKAGAGEFSGKPMWRVAERPSIAADDVVIDREKGGLIFARFYGSDASINQLLASLTLPVGEGGLRRVTMTRIGPDTPPPNEVARMIQSLGAEPDSDDGYDDDDDDDDGSGGEPGAKPCTDDYSYSFADIAHRETFSIHFGDDTSKLSKLTGRISAADAPGFPGMVWCWIYSPRASLVDVANGVGSVMMSKERFERQGDEACWQLVKKLSSIPLLNAWREKMMVVLRDIESVSHVYSSAGDFVCVSIKLPYDMRDFVSGGLRSGMFKIDPDLYPDNAPAAQAG